MPVRAVANVVALLALYAVATPVLAAHVAVVTPFAGISLVCKIRPDSQTTSEVFISNNANTRVHAGQPVALKTERGSQAHIILPAPWPSGTFHLSHIAIVGKYCTARTETVMALPDPGH
jgi:hypothetical protein